MKVETNGAVEILRPYERYGCLFPRMGLCWLAEEGGPDVQVEILDKPVQSFNVDDIDLNEKDEATEETETEIEVEGKANISTDKSEVAELKQQIQELQSDLLKVTLHAKEKPRQQEEPKQEKLTKAQIAAILKEHKDNPEVLLNVIDYISEQKATEIKDSTMKDVNQRQWHSQLSGMANQVLNEDNDGYLAANPKVKSGLEEYANNLGLGDHPVGKLAAYAIFRLSEAAKTKSKEDDKKSSKDETKDTINKGKMDKTRLTNLRDKNKGLTTEQLSMAKRFGVKPETYAKFVGGSNG